MIFRLGPLPGDNAPVPVTTTFAAFCDAVTTGSIGDLDVVFEPDAERLTRRALSESGMLLLGECHGVAENAAVIRALVAHLHIETVALEWPAELQPLVNSFLTGGGLTDSRFLWLGDGRVTAEHFVAMKSLARNGVAIVLIDKGLAPSGSWSERDRALADAALEATSDRGRAILIAGNAHTPVTKTMLGTPMGAWIAQARPGIREIVIRYGSGTMFNFGTKAFPDRFGHEPSACLCIVDGDLQLRVPRASAATVAFSGLPRLA